MPDDAPGKKRDFSLAWRLSLSAIIIPLLIFLFWWDNRLGETALVLLGLCLLLGLRASGE
ncbi:MAG: phosphatidate cytidylyltransferase, partial [Planctomycetes bacterium]|nr:phosphatidate cytidylyltransferase [Planctomycetota bacterium]